VLQQKKVPWGGKNFLRGGGAYERLGKQKYTKYIKIYNNLKNIKGSEIASRRGFAPLAPHSCGLPRTQQAKLPACFPQYLFNADRQAERL